MYDYIGAMGSIVPLSTLTLALWINLWITCGNLRNLWGGGGNESDFCAVKYPPIYNKSQKSIKKSTCVYLCKPLIILMFTDPLMYDK